jgi:hypothetical protein
MCRDADTKKDCSSELTPPIRPNVPWRIAEVRPLPDFGLWVRFNDGTEGTVTMANFLRSARAGVFAALLDEGLFSRVALEHGAVTWPGELDLAPDAMYEAIRRVGKWELQ